MQQIKITTSSPEYFRHVFERIMNLACIAAQAGYLPEHSEKADPIRYGRFWYREENKIHLFPAGNDYKAFLSDETDNSVTVEFHYRYSRGAAFENALCALVKVQFHDYVEVLNA